MPTALWPDDEHVLAARVKPLELRGFPFSTDERKREFHLARSTFHDEHAAMSVVTDAVGGVAEQPAPKFRMVAVADDN